MVIDTSALIAVLENEPERSAFNELVTQAPICRISAVTYVETSIVLEKRRGRTALHDLIVYIGRAGIQIEPVQPEHAEVAIEAYRKYGKGNHQAGLNLVDVFSYGLAKVTNEPLLFKGFDFAMTDILVAAKKEAED